MNDTITKFSGRTINPQETIEQLGSGWNSALVYMGAKKITHNQDTVHIKVNGKKSQQWFIAIKIEANDTYTVYFVRVKGRDMDRDLKTTEVYCDELKGIVEKTYDDAINKYNGGFINI